MATITQTALTRPVNSAVALAALKAANTAQDASQDTTVKLIALRKELDALRAERDAARFRVEDLEAQTSRLHQALQRTSAATSALRNCPRRLPRSMSFMAALASFALAGMAFWTTPAAATGPDDELAYACTMGDRPTMHLDLIQGRYRFANRVGALRQGMGGLNFTTPAGFTVFLDFGDLDRVYTRMPATISGSGQVAKGTLQQAIASAINGHDFSASESVVCQRTR
jgi:hypothetical protein